MIKIITDSTCDLHKDYMKDNNDVLRFNGMPVVIEKEEYIDDLGENFTHDFFYNQLRGGAFPKTSQINVTSFYNMYENFYEEGDTIFVLGLSSGLSGTINNANLAKSMFEEEKGQVDIRVMDTVAASSGLGVLIMEVVRKIRNEESVEAIQSWLDRSTLKVNHWFAIDELNHLKNGGRISSASAMIGTALKVKPILTMNHSGKLELHSTVRGRNKSIKFLVNKLKENYEIGSDYIINVGHGDCEEDAFKLKKAILEEFENAEVPVTKLSATIASHVGAGMLAIAFVGKVNRER